MAGTLLLISRNDRNQQLLDKINRLENYINSIFRKYFYKIHFHKFDNAYLVEFRKDDNLKFYEDKAGNWLTFEGNVFDLNESKSYNAEELLLLYKDSGEDIANRLDGHFIIKIYDAQKDRYLIINDYIKSKTNFICEADDFIMFTPFLITTGIIKKPELDKFAFNEFMWRYYILSERTMLKNVQRLSPATIYTVKKGKLFKKTYWEWPHQYTKLYFNESVEKMVENMQETARLINISFGKPCIDFTMGQDSRQIVSAFTNQNLPFATATFGKQDFYEVEKVKEMTQRNNIENHNIQLQENYCENIWKIFEKAIIIGSCEQPGYLLGRILYMRSQYRKYGKVSLNGMDGHFYKNGLWDELYSFNLYREPNRFNIDMFLKLRALSKNYSEDIFRPDFLEIKSNSKQYFTEIVKVAIINYLDSPVSIQVDKFDLYHWLNFGIAGNSAVNFIFPSLSPLLFRRNLELAIQIPVKWKFNLSKFQRAVVYRLDSLLAKEKTDFGGVNMIPKNILTYIQFYFRYFYFQSTRFRNKIKNKLGMNVVTHLQKAWDYLPIYKLLFQDENFQEYLIYKNMYLSEIIKEDEWNDLINRYNTSDNITLNEYEYIFKLVSVERFLKLANQI
jgi:hypothetical protein